MSEAGVSSAELGQPEVQDLHVPIRGHHDVGGLEVPVDDALLVSRSQGIGYGGADLEHLRQGQAARGEDLLEVPALDQFHGQEADALGLPRPSTCARCAG